MQQLVLMALGEHRVVVQQACKTIGACTAPCAPGRCSARACPTRSVRAYSRAGTQTYCVHDAHARTCTHANARMYARTRAGLLAKLNDATVRRLIAHDLLSAVRSLLHSKDQVGVTVPCIPTVY